METFTVSKFMLVLVVSIIICIEGFQNEQEAENKFIFRKMGKINLYFLEYHVIYIINTSYVTGTLEALEKLETNITIVSEKLSKEGGAMLMWGMNLASITKLAVAELGRYREEVRQFAGITGLRVKRSLFDLGGKLLNGMFGVLDQEEKGELLKKIETVEHAADENLKQALKVEKGIQDKMINRTEKLVLIADQLHDQFQQIAGQSALDESKIEFIQNEIMTSSSSLSLWLLAKNSREEIQKFMRAITETIYGRLSPELITPEELFNLLYKINTELKHPWRFVYSLGYDTIENFYSIIKGTLLFEKGEIKIVLSIPIVTEESEFDKYEIIKMPFWSSKLNSFITKQTQKYIYVSKSEELYFLADDGEIECRGMNSVCKISTVLNKAEAESCEWNEYKGRKSICKELVLLNHDLFMRRYEDKVLYATRKETEAIVVCRDMRGHKIESRIILKKSGILSKMNACDIVTRTVVSLATRQFDMFYEVARDKLDALNFYVRQVEHKFDEGKYSHIQEIKAEIDVIKNTSINTVELEDVINKMKQKSYVNTFYNWHVSTGLSILCLVIVIVVIIICMCKRKDALVSVVNVERNKEETRSPRVISLDRED